MLKELLVLMLFVWTKKDLDSQTVAVEAISPGDRAKPGKMAMSHVPRISLLHALVISIGLASVTSNWRCLSNTLSTVHFI